MEVRNLFRREFRKIKQKAEGPLGLDVASFCQTVIGYKTKSDAEKIDAMLELDCTLYTMLGCDSTASDKKYVKKMSRLIYRTIKSINKPLGDSLLSHMDKDD